MIDKDLVKEMYIYTEIERRAEDQERWRVRCRGPAKTED